MSTPFTRLSVFLTACLCLASSAWGDGSKPAAKELTNLAYKTAGDSYETERCKLDLYLPEKKKATFATLVWLHGGGITGGSKDGAHQIALGRHLAASGTALASINYRLSPKAKYPAYIEDTAAAFAWVKQHIAEHGGDPARVYLGGHSAGAYLALMAALDGKYLGAQGLKIQDIAGLVPVAGQTLTHYTIREERGLPKSRLIADEAAPIFHARKDAPPMLILYAERDMALRGEENQLLAAALRQAGANHLKIQMVKGTDHGSVGHDLEKDENAGSQAVVRFLQTGEL